MDRVRALQAHERTRAVGGATWGFRYRGRALPGLHRTLKAHWVRPSRVKRVSPKSGIRPSSKAVGRRVDRELGRVAQGKKLTALGRRCPYTLAALAFLKRHGLRPVAAQLPVVSLEGGGWATAVDLVAVRDDTVYIIELKTGRSAMGTPGVYLRAPLDRVRDTDGARHALQLAYMTECLRNEYGLRRHRGLLLYLQQSAATREVRAVRQPAPTWARTQAQRTAIWRAATAKAPPRTNAAKGKRRRR